MMLSMTAPPGPLTRRSSERELDGSKKRATSAGGINRNKGEGEYIWNVLVYDIEIFWNDCLYLILLVEVILF